MSLDPRNPFAEPSALPYELPDFAAIRPEHYLDAVREGMAEQLAELAELAADPRPATEENVIAAWERSGRVLARALAAFYNVQPADTTPELDAVDEAIAPQLARHSDAIHQDRALFDRLTELAARRDAGEVTLDAQADHWLATHLRDFNRGGVGLPAEQQQRLRDLNERIAELQSAFGRVALAGSNAAAVEVTDETELAGLSESAKAGARAAAEGRGLSGGWLIELDSCTPQRPLAELTDRALRERLHTAATTRGLGGEHDTRALVVELARARAERAELLGFANHAEYVTAEACAKTAAAVNGMLHRLAPAAVGNARAEAEDLAALAGHDLQPWDWEFYAEKLRAERFQLDDHALRPYLELERVLRDGVFAAATALFGITFAERHDLRGYNDEVRVWEVFDTDGRGLGLFLGDFYTRTGKQGGAWMNNLVDQNRLLGQRPVVTNNLNLVKPPAGRPTLLAWEEVTTLFHEFGHALHGLLSDTRYPSQSGANTPRDFVEFPSQVNEMWQDHPVVLARYAVHHRTGEPIPAKWIDVIAASRQFNAGFTTTELLAASLLDQAWHQTPLDDLPRTPEEVPVFEARALADAGVDFPLVPSRYRTTYFKHIFEGGYAAGYYSYIWSEVLDADTVAWFIANGGPTRDNGERFRRLLLAPGGSVEAMDSYRAFRGADPDIVHLLARRGLDA